MMRKVIQIIFNNILNEIVSLKSKGFSFTIVSSGAVALAKKQQINHKELFYPKEHTEYIYSNGWNLKALYALLIGSIFSLSSLLNENLVQYQSFGWIIGAFASYLVYYLLNNK